MKIETKFNYKEKVYIPEIKAHGRIVEIFISNEIQYKVSFWIESELKLIYFYEDELQCVT